jgi:hypothetical protein
MQFCRAFAQKVLAHGCSVCPLFKTYFAWSLFDYKVIALQYCRFLSMGCTDFDLFSFQFCFFGPEGHEFGIFCFHGMEPSEKKLLGSDFKIFPRALGCHNLNQNFIDD